MTRSLRILVTGMLGLAASAGAATLAELPLDEPRAFGHVVGDVLQRRVHLGAAVDLAPQALPRPSRVDTWFELREARLQGRGDRAELLLSYQLVNAPQKVSTLALPTLRLPVTVSGRSGWLEIPEWPVSAAPLTPETVLSREGLQAMQPDINPVAPPRLPLQRRLALWLALALGASAVLLLRRHPEWAVWRRHAPFAQALRELRTLPRSGGDDLARQACQRLHRAFDQAAGRTLFAPALAAWLHQRPGLAPLAEPIQAFFQASQRGFFEAGAPLPPVDEVLALCRRLAQAEGQGA